MNGRLRSNCTSELLAAAVGSCLALASLPASAQSTATRIAEDRVEEVVVTAERAPRVAGLIQPERATKSRSSVGAEYLATQLAGQTVVQSLNLLPGVSFTNTDPYGSSGGNLRMRSFDGPRISLMLDGMQLNDSGNYAIYTNQQVDPEIIERTTVNLGTTDVDSPTASATGGTINIITQRPLDTARLQLQPSIGSHDYRRMFTRLDTGAFGPWNTTAYVAASFQEYDKYKGPGDLEKTQLNARIHQDLGNGDFVSLSVHANRNRNNFYRNLSKAQIAENGWDFDNDPTCTRLPAAAGSAQNEGDAEVSCTNYHGLRINPSNTGNIRGQASFGLSDALRLTIDPSFQYVLANGGGFTVVPETDRRLIGASGTPGVDLNGDGDTLDSIALYTPNTTNTHRYSVNSSLIWYLDDDSLLRFGYTFDRARHRQTGQWGWLDEHGNPENVFAGRDGRPVLTADGAELRGRDRLSTALLNQVSLAYSSRALDGRLRYDIGLRAPFFERELNQYCHTSITGGQYCTTQPASAPDANGLVTFEGVNGSFLPPYGGTRKYDDLLPSVGISFEPWRDGHLFYASYAAGLSAPRTDNLYNVQILDVEPETTDSFDFGWRYNGPRITSSTALWYSRFDNRIVSSFDPDLGLSVDRNVGRVDLWGIDAEVGVRATDHLSLYGSASYNNSEVKNDIPFNSTVFVPTAGKELVETPEWTLAARAQYVFGGLQIGLQGKYVGERWATDVNDESAPSFTVLDADLRYAFDAFGLKQTYVQLNVTNLLDRQYLGSIATSRFSADRTQPYGNVPFYSVGAPRTYQLTVGLSF